MLKRFLFVIIAVLAVSSAGAEEPDLTAAVRTVLEASLREAAGVGFEQFSCDGKPPLGPGDRFRCGAVDEDGDQLRYTIEVDDEGGAKVVRSAQPAASLPADGLAMLEAPSRAFLAAYHQRRWQELFDELHPGLQAKLGDSDGVSELLDPIRTALGGVEAIAPVWFAVRFSGEQQLEYLLRCEKGAGEARFQFATDDQGQARLFAFVVNVPPGSSEQAALLDLAAREALAPTVGATIERVEAPLQTLLRRGDSVEGTAFLEGGRQVHVMVNQHGVRDDFDTNDYRFAVLEVELLIERALRPQLDGLTAVSCAERKIPDGGETTCTATVEGGEARHFVIRRFGGEHRLFPAEADEGAAASGSDHDEQ